MQPQPYSFHALPAVFLMETQLPENLISQLNDYLDKLMLDENRIDH